MIKQYNGAKAQRRAAREILPKGGYVAKILDAKVQNYDFGDKLVLSFDVAEGPYNGFFKRDYNQNPNEDKKWRGVVRLSIPKDDGSEKDGFTKKSFAGWTKSFEDSNKGYVWDWDENKWVGKIIGIVFGETGTKIEGKDVIYTEARFAVDAQKVRDGKAPEAKFKAKNGYNGSANNNPDDEFLSVPAGKKEELPF